MPFWFGVALTLALAVLERVVFGRSRESSRQLPDLDALPTVVWGARGDGSLEYVNRAFLTATGLPKDAALGWQWLTLLDADDVRPAMRRLRHALRLRQPYELEYRVRLSDGQYRWQLVRGTPRFDAAGSLQGWLGTWTDIDDRKRSEQGLHLLLDVGSQLLSSLGLRESYAAAARTLVPAHADWLAFVTLNAPGQARITTCVHADREQAASAQALVGTTFSPRAGLGTPASRGSAQVWERVPADWLDDLPPAAQAQAARLGTASAVSVPIRQGHRVAALLVLGRSAASPPFTGRDVPIYLELARRLALVIAFAESYDNERRVATSFQRAALPTDLPRHGRVVFDAVYEAGRSEALVGGDWYDAFLLVDGRVVVSIGDVSGNGLAAAVTMGTVRQSMRAAARVDAAPLAILEAADRTLRGDQPDRIVTAFVGVFDPYSSEFAYAGAGHPPPLLRAPDGTLVELGAGGVPLGLRQRSQTRQGVVALPPGSLVALYTDGLTEATRDVFEGERRLRAALADPHLLGAAKPATALQRAVLPHGSHDDVAILTMTVRAVVPESERVTREWTILDGDGEAAVAARHDFTQALRDAGIAEPRLPGAELVFGELVANALAHAGGRVEVRLEWNASRPVLHVLDEGPGYAARARDVDAFAERGRGLFLVAMLAEEFTVSARQSGGSHSRAVLACEARAL